MSYTQHPIAATKEAAAESARTEGLAIQCMTLAVQSMQGATPTNEQLTDRAEWIWLWITSEGSAVVNPWPKPEGAP